MSNKRRRDAASIDTQLIEIYEDLANENEEIRLKAAQSLLRKASIESSPSKEQLTKVITRLIRGLCSGRKAARLGFSIAFTELIAQHLGVNQQATPGQLDFLEVLDILIKQTDISGNVSGQEERDHQLGRLFGAEAFIKSGMLFHAKSTEDAWSQILELIFGLAQKKAWLREECGWILYKSIQNLKVQVNGSTYAQTIIDKLIANGLAKCPEGVAIWLGIQSIFPGVSLPSSVWQHESPLYRKEKASLSKILKEASTTGPLQPEANSKIAQNSSWSPNLHFAWDVVLSAILLPNSTNQSKSLKLITFADFWTEAVDNNLFSYSASDQRKYWGFVLFQRAIHIVPASFITIIFSANFMRCFMNQLASSDRYLHRNAEKAVKAIHARIETDPSLAVTVLMCLLKPPYGRVNFDQITKTKTIEKLLIQANDNHLGDLVQCCSHIISSPSSQDDKTASVERQVSADHLLTVVRSRHTLADAQLSGQSQTALFIKQALALMAQYAYFEPKKNSSPNIETISPPISDTTRSMFRSRITSCLTHVLARCKQPTMFVYDLVSFIRLQDQQEESTPTFKADEGVSELMNKGLTILDKVHSKEKSAQGPRKRFLSAFELLYALVLLQIYNGDADAVGMLDDLKSCYDTLIKHKSKSEQASTDALIEILLGFAAKPSALFRRLASQVFSTCTSDISQEGLQSMIKILETKESVAGQDELFDQEDLDGENDGASDVEVNSVSSQHDEDDTSNATSIEGTDNDEDDEDSTAAAEELAAFDAKLALALGTRPATDNLNANDEDESSDEDMNDEQMEALDEHLEKVFRERKNVNSNKSQKKDAKEAIVNFKCRVLELLDIYIKQEHKNPLALQLLVPLLNVIRITKTAVVSTKACDLLATYFKLCRPNSVPEIPDTESVLAVLRTVHQQAAKDGSNAYSSACSKASLLLVKILVAQNREHLRLIESIYSQTHESFMLDPKSKVKPSFFSDWLNWSVTARKS